MEVWTLLKWERGNSNANGLKENQRILLLTDAVLKVKGGVTAHVKLGERRVTVRWEFDSLNAIITSCQLTYT